MKKIMPIVAFAVIVIATSALTSLVVAKNIDALNPENNSTKEKTSLPVTFTNSSSNNNTTRPADFTYAAEKSVEAVVHVKTKIDVSSQYQMNIDPFFDFFLPHSKNMLYWNCKIIHKEVRKMIFFYIRHGDPVYDFIKKKQNEGKACKVAKIAGFNKFLRIYYARVTEYLNSLQVA